MLYKTSVCGMYRSEENAKKSIKQLIASGFKDSNIQYFFRKKDGHQDFIHAQPTNLIHGAFIGSIVGFFLLGFIGYFIGYNTTSAVRIGEFSLYNQSSVPTMLVNTLTGALAGLLLGAACGALAGIGIPVTVNHRYNFYLQEGGVLVAAHYASKKEHDKAVQIFQDMGAQDIAELYDTQIMNLSVKT